MKTYLELTGNGEDKKQEKEFNKTLREMCKLTNDSGLLEVKIKHVGKKGAEMYDNFTFAIEELIDKSIASNLPEKVIDFYNFLAEDEFEEEEETPDVEELDFDGDQIPEPEPEYDNLEDKIIEEVYEPDYTAGEESEEETEVESESETEEPDLTSEPSEETEIPKMKRLSKTPLTTKVEEDVLVLDFSQIGEKKIIKLPERGDKEALRAVRKEAFAFADAHNATRGQKQGISKYLNEAGYYMR